MRVFYDYIILHLIKIRIEHAKYAFFQLKIIMKIKYALAHIFFITILFITLIKHFQGLKIREFINL